MRQKINNVDIIDIDVYAGKGILSEINKLTEGNLKFSLDYPYLNELYDLLNGSFNSSIHKVHHISKRDSL